MEKLFIYVTITVKERGIIYFRFFLIFFSSLNDLRFMMSAESDSSFIKIIPNISAKLCGAEFLKPEILD